MRGAAGAGTSTRKPIRGYVIGPLAFRQFCMDMFFDCKNVIACMSSTREKHHRADRPLMAKVLCIGQDPGGPAHLPARQPFFSQPKKCTLQIFSFFFFHENEAKCHGCRASGIFLGDAEILKKVSLFVCWVGLGGWRSAHVIGGTGMETKEIVCFACVLRQISSPVRMLIHSFVISPSSPFATLQVTGASERVGAGAGQTR